MNNPIDLHGHKSRKWVLAIFSMLLLALIALMAGPWPTIKEVYAELSTAIVALYGLYSGANAVVKNIYSKNADKLNKAIVDDKGNKQPVEQIPEK